MRSTWQACDGAGKRRGEGLGVIAISSLLTEIGTCCPSMADTKVVPAGNGSETPDAERVARPVIVDRQGSVGQLEPALTWA